MLQFYVLWTDTIDRFLLGLKKIYSPVKVYELLGKAGPGTSLTLAIWASALSKYHISCLGFFSMQVVMIRLKGKKIILAHCSSQKYKSTAYLPISLTDRIIIN